ncbi:MAG: flagellin [Sulfurimonadaceae bacterium]|nr:flagellin [Sulfurimonadaceae bacterium]
MGFRINTNVGAMYAHMNSTQNSLQVDKSLQSLSSGLRINKAADDSAGLAIANKLSAQSMGLGQAISNANEGIGLIQTADGALEEYTNVLKRIRTLAIKGANDTQDEDSRQFIQDEMQRLVKSLSSIAANTKFNGMQILNETSADSGTFTFHIGAYEGETADVTITSVVPSSRVGAAVTTINGGALSRTDFDTLICNMTAGIKSIDTTRSNLGSVQNQLESTVRNISVTQVNVSAAESQIRDVDFAAESANFAKRNILGQSGSYAMSQANATQQNVLRLLQ